MPTDSQASSKFVSVAQAAELLELAPETVRVWFDKGVLDGFRTPGKHRRILRSSVETLMEGAA